MKTLVCKLTVFSFLSVCLWLAPSAAQAANYGAVYYPSLAPEAAALNNPETFLDGITPGMTYTVIVSVTNAGTMTWVAADPNAFHLSYHWAGPASLYDGERTVLPYDVAPGETVYLKATLIAPAVPGTYTLQWDMVHENITWFSNQGVPTEDQIVGVGGEVGADQGGSGQILYKTEYCRWTDCSDESEGNPENCVIPQITSGPANTLYQGSFVSVLGCGYGPQSKLYLLLPASNMEVELEIQGIFPHLIAAHVPESLVAKDQIGSLVVRNPGSQSNLLPVSFQTLKEMVLLPQDKIQVVSCSPSADANYCNDAYSIDTNVFCCILDTTGFLNPLNSFSSIESFHQTDGSLFGDSGKDVYSVKLASGWTLEKMDFGVQIMNGGGSVNQPAGFVKGATSATITVEWSVGGNSGTAYYIDLYAIGPKGTKP